MLHSPSQTTSGAARRTLCFLPAIVIAVLALPTLKWASHAQSAGSFVAVLDDVAPPEGPGAAGAADRREKPRAEQDRDIVPEPEVEYLPRPSKFEQQVLAALETPVDIEFSKLALEDCIGFLQKESKIPMWFDRQTLVDEGVAIDQPITLNLKSTRLESVLNLLLHPVQLTYVPENEVLMITTTQKASEKLITRTYPVRDLIQVPKLPNAGSPAAESPSAESPSAGSPSAKLPSAKSPSGKLSDTPHDAPANSGAEKPETPADKSTEKNPPAGAAPQVLKQGVVSGGGSGGGGQTDPRPAGYQPPRDGLDFSSLMNLMSTAIEPDSWAELSGPGSMMPHRITHCLVIRQTWDIHRKVQQLLRDLREAKHIASGGKNRAPRVDDK